MGTYPRGHCRSPHIEDMDYIMVISRESLDTASVESLWMAEHPDMPDAVFVRDQSGELIVHCRDRVYRAERSWKRFRREDWEGFTEVY